MLFNYSSSCCAKSFSFLFFLLTQWLFCLQDYEKACDAFLDGLKLDPANVVIEKALRYCTDSSYLSLSSDSMSDNSDFHTHILFRNFVVLRHTLWLTSELDNCVASESIRASCTCHVLLHLHLKCFSNGHNLLCRDAVNCLKTLHTAK